MRICVLGAGTWGTALAALLVENGHELCLWSKFPPELERLKSTGRHPNLPGLELPAQLRFSSELEVCVPEAELLVMAVPSVHVRATAEALVPYVSKTQILVNVAKGIEAESLMTMSELIASVLPGPELAVLSGPSHAEEVAKRLPTTIVVGADSERTARRVQDCFMNERFRVYINPDVRGIEIGAALKNVIALAAGVADGLGYGDNTKAALITRGIAEISRLGTAMGCDWLTFTGLSGIGDLIVTCASVHSRNRRAGMLIGQGLSMEEACRQVQMVVEGVYAAKAAYALAQKYEVSMPIITQVYALLFEGKPPAQAVSELMLRDKNAEHTHLQFKR